MQHILQRVQTTSLLKMLVVVKCNVRVIQMYKNQYINKKKHSTYNRRCK